MNDPQDNIVVRLMRAIPLGVLKKNLSKIYELYKNEKGEYTLELFGRAEEDIEDDKPDSHYELIIESGFSIYILIKLFLENKKS